MRRALGAGLAAALRLGCGGDGETQAPDADPGPTLPFEIAYADAWTFRGITEALVQSIGLVLP